LKKRTLLDAVATPDAGEDQYLHLAFKTAYKLVLWASEVCKLIDLQPSALLFLASCLKVTIIWK
jgi:hypothetical protein